jgi:DNA-binding transcriptional LysR family regulator
MKWSDRVGRRVKLRDLHIALAVAESGSMSKAAELLAVSYPVVSKTISELEHTLGVKLFDRSISGAEPTHYGRALLKCGRAVFDEMRQGLESIEFIRQPDSGDLRIGSSELMDGGLLPAIIEEFSRLFPRVALHVLHSNIALQQYDSLRNRQVELVLGQHPMPFVEYDLIAETLFDDSTFVVTGTDSPLAKRRKVALADLMEEPWVLTQPGSLPRALQEQIFKMNGVKVPTASVSTLSLQLYTRLVETGHWLGLVPGSVIRFGEKRLRIMILPIRLRTPLRPVGLITVRNRTLSPLAEHFIDCARKVARVDSFQTKDGARSVPRRP